MPDVEPLRRGAPGVRGATAPPSRVRRSASLAVVAALAVAAAGSCVPDGPQGDIPTHPSERFSVHLAWDAPLLAANGDSLTDLAAFRLYHSSSNPPAGPDATMIDVGAETEHTVHGLVAGVHYFAVTALDQAGNESVQSEVLQVEVGQP